MTDTPAKANGDSIGYWTAAAEGRLEFQRCTACGHVQFPPRHQCATCWSPDLEPIVSSGRGVIESVTIVRRAPLPAFRDLVPYAVAAVAVKEGPRMMTNVVGEGALDAAIGDTVRVVFSPDASGRTLPQFTLARTAR